MSLVFSAIVPHPPLLIPTIGREHAKMLEKTSAALGQLAMNLAAARPETILVISPHLGMMPENFLVNHAPKCQTHFLEFGDFSPPREFATDSLLVERIRRACRYDGQNIITVSDQHLDYGSSVPLTVLTPNDKKTAAVVIAPSTGASKFQFAFGQAVKEAIMNANRRVALICSGDFSHRLSSDTPAGFSPKGREFDDLLLSNLATGNASPVLQMNRKLVEEAHACGYNAICVLLGIMDKIDCRPEMMCYEAPYGVGYCTMEYHLK